MVGPSTTSVEWSNTASFTSGEAKNDVTLSTSLSTKTIYLLPSSLSEDTSTSTSASLIELSTTLASELTSPTTPILDSLSTFIMAHGYETQPSSLSTDPAIVSTSSSMIDFATFTSTGFDISITESVETTTTVPVSTTTDLASSYTEAPTTYTTEMLTTDSASLPITTSASSVMTSSSPATTSSAAPFMFKAFARGGIWDGSEIRAHTSAPYSWMVGYLTVQKPTILTIEPRTGHLLIEGSPVCAESGLGSRWVRIRGYPSPMLPRHEYVRCDPGVDGDELRCRVHALSCVGLGVGMGYGCEHTGQEWTQFHSSNWLPSTYYVTMAPSVNDLEPQLAMTLVMNGI
ncbi:uncharacterized protein B0J16DRAFT_386442 [Fusarium flagelliforme]|uniref:uncharacterized protein n=1 Tax=Fusarium flagelliforme TaxID=2675880 RepID=UPI001E8D3BED|nr:uncharacterized protein B0J16DRAFT_386442 [Fusarium flagelliforme]KAH7183385.1 hypothetical protein B0J16DRAFT_386442 [Fusarium flagelliforme]